MNKRKNTLAASDWLDIALQVVAEEGMSALAVEPLAKRMGVTKGSFYWHFKNRQELVSALLDFWENLELEYQNSLTGVHKDPAELLKMVLRVLIEDSTNKRILLALSNEQVDDEIKACYGRAVKRRIGLFSQIYRDFGFEKQDAERRAYILFFTYLGLIKSLTRDKGEKSVGGSLAEVVNQVIESAMPSEKDLAAI